MSAPFLYLYACVRAFSSVDKSSMVESQTLAMNLKRRSESWRMAAHAISRMLDSFSEVAVAVAIADS